MKDENGRIENLLVIILLSLLKGSTMAEKSSKLNLAGFSNIQIANYLETTSAVIGQLLYENRKKGKKIKNAKDL